MRTGWCTAPSHAPVQHLLSAAKQRLCVLQLRSHSSNLCLQASTNGHVAGGYRMCSSNRCSKRSSNRSSMPCPACWQHAGPQPTTLRAVASGTKPPHCPRTTRACLACSLLLPSSFSCTTAASRLACRRAFTASKWSCRQGNNAATCTLSVHRLCTHSSACIMPAAAEAICGCVQALTQHKHCLALTTASLVSACMCWSMLSDSCATSGSKRPGRPPVLLGNLCRIERESLREL